MSIPKIYYPLEGQVDQDVSSRMLITASCKTVKNYMKINWNLVKEIVG